MSKHTPGPWTAIFQEDWRSTKVVTADGRWIADVSMFGDSADANARLIAAAPELLEAVQALLESERRSKYHGWEAGCPDWHKSWEQARAAVTNATE